LAYTGPGVDSPGHTILVVDDDASIRLVCRINLELDGFVVREAATVEAARAALSDGAVDVVLLDVHVGSESGADFVEELREDHAGVAVAMLTGSVGSATLDGVAADAFIPKPFRVEQLTATVRELASRIARPAR
jgi:DNA-binding response OmpR family regulator